MLASTLHTLETRKKDLEEKLDDWEKQLKSIRQMKERTTTNVLKLEEEIAWLKHTVDKNAKSELEVSPVYRENINV
jgi:hypothetical protein